MGVTTVPLVYPHQQCDDETSSPSPRPLSSLLVSSCFWSVSSPSQQISDVPPPVLTPDRLAHHFWPDHSDRLPLVLLTLQERRMLEHLPWIKDLQERGLQNWGALFEAFFEMQSHLFELHSKEGQALENASSLLLFRSSEQRIILNWIFSRAYWLQRGELQQRTGIASMTLLGNKGIGKTVCLQVAAKLVPLFFPHVVPVYISFSTVKEMFLEDGEDLVDHMILVALEKSGVDVQKYERGAVGLVDVMDVLKGEGKYVMLILDEFENVFRKNTDARDDIVSRVAAYGGHTSGHISVILTGSSNHLYRLVTGTAYNSPDAMKKYPLCERRFSMNGDKLSRKILPSSLPQDVDKVARMIQTVVQERFDALEDGFVQDMWEIMESVKEHQRQQQQELVRSEKRTQTSSNGATQLGETVGKEDKSDALATEVADYLAPIVAFFYGTSARAVEKFFRDVALGQGCWEKEDLFSSGDSRSVGNERLQMAVMCALRRKNEALVKEIEEVMKKGAEPLLGYLLESGWQDRLQGVELQEVMDLVREDESLLSDYNVRGNQWMLQSLIQDDLGKMYDEDTIRFRYRIGNPSIVFPVSMVQMLSIGNGEMDRLVDTVGRALQKMVAEAA